MNDNNTSSKKDSFSGSMPSMYFVPVARVRDFAQGRMLCREIQGLSLALFQVEGKYYALKNSCTHSGGALCEGSLEGNIVECPLHGAKFDVRTGDAVLPPATRPVRTYRVRVQGDVIELELPAVQKPEQPKTPKKEKNYFLRQNLWFALIIVIFWSLEFAAQYFWLSKKELGPSLIRSFALYGTTLLGLSLFSSAIFKWLPKTARHWRYRRRLGVSGFLCILFHIFFVYYFIFKFNILGSYYSLNPLQNPIIFGSIAYPIFFIMAVTSNDWSVRFLGARRWKFIHRFVYIAYGAAVFHFLLINPAILKTPPGLLLIALTVLALFGQLYWFIKTIIKNRFRGFAPFVGCAIILIYLVMGYLAFF